MVTIEAASSELQSGPGFVDGADLVVDQAGGEPDLAYNGLGEIAGQGGCFLGPRDPQAAFPGDSGNAFDAPLEFLF